MPTTSTIGGVQNLQNLGAASGIALLKELNPQLDVLMQENPGVGVLLRKLDANGAILAPKPTDKKTNISFAMWSHSKASGGMPVEPYKDIIVIYQDDPGAKDIGIGGGCRGKVIGVYRLDQFAFSSEAEARKFNPKLQVKQFEPGKWVHISDDQCYRGSYEWKNMPVNAYGTAGKPFEVSWAVIGVGAQGNVLGGGYGGWEGRSCEGTFGKDTRTLMPNH